MNDVLVCACKVVWWWILTFTWFFIVNFNSSMTFCRRSFMEEIALLFLNISFFERNCSKICHTWLSGKLILKLEILGQIWNLCKENFDDSQTFCSTSPLSISIPDIDIKRAKVHYSTFKQLHHLYLAKKAGGILFGLSNKQTNTILH